MSKWTKRIRYLINNKAQTPGVEFRWLGGTAILALEYFGSWGHDDNSNNCWRAPRQLKIIKGHHSKLCIYSHLTSYSLDWIDEREEAGVVPPPWELAVFSGNLCFRRDRIGRGGSIYLTRVFFPPMFSFIVPLDII